MESTQYRNSEARLRYVSITLPYILEIDVGMETYSAVMRNLGTPLYRARFIFGEFILRVKCIVRPCSRRVSFLINFKGNAHCLPIYSN